MGIKTMQELEKDLKRFEYGMTKAEKARRLLKLGYDVSAISRAVPMAYSQVHSIAKKEGIDATYHGTPGAQIERAVKASRRPATTATIKVESAGMRQATSNREAWGKLPPTAHSQRQARKPTKTKLRPGIGKLRTPGLPSDIDVGECANCGHDVAVRRLPTGFALIHINATAEEYLKVIQFCTAMPKVLLS